MTFYLLWPTGSGATALLLGSLKAVTTPSPSPAASLALLLTLLASRLLRLERRAPFALSLFAMLMRALLLRLFAARRFLTARLVALLLAALAAAVPLAMRRLRLALALPALLHRPVLALTAWAFALAAILTTAARILSGRRPRDFRHRRFLNGFAREPAEQFADDGRLLRGRVGTGR